MASIYLTRVRRPPPLYRLARVFRRVSLVALVLLILYLATVGYSASELVQSSPRSGGFSAGFAANNSVSIQGSFSLSNPGMYPVSALSLEMRIQNGSGALLGAVVAGPVTLAPQAATTFPISVYLPIQPVGAAASLLVSDQYLTLGLWGNATYAYLFPISIHFDQQRSWGAPFSNLRISVGTPVVGGGNLSAPVTVGFTNHASFAEVGNLALALLSARGAACGEVSFSLAVPPSGFYFQTENAAMTSGCSLSGGSAVATFVGSGASIVLPPEALP